MKERAHERGLEREGLQLVREKAPEREREESMGEGDGEDRARRV